MKTQLSLIAALTCGLSATSSAFTLDFLSVPTGTTLPPTLTINVPGYGNVSFNPVSGSSLVVDDRHELDNPGITSSPSLNFDTGEGVILTFLGAQPTGIDFVFVGANVGEFFTPVQGASVNEFIITLNGAASEPNKSGAGIYQIGFNQVPEPSASLLGVLGASLLVIRRRR